MKPQNKITNAEQY